MRIRCDLRDCRRTALFVHSELTVSAIVTDVDCEMDTGHDGDSVVEASTKRDEKGLDRNNPEAGRHCGEALVHADQAEDFTELLE